jgi:hypothetical protein
MTTPSGQKALGGVDMVEPFPSPLSNTSQQENLTHDVRGLHNLVTLGISVRRPVRDRPWLGGINIH